MQRRLFLMLAAAVPPVIWLGGVGEVILIDRFVLDPSGRCSFCNRAPHEARAMAGVVGRSVRICNECIALCCELIGEELRGRALSDVARQPLSRAERLLEEQAKAKQNDLRAWLKLGDAHAKAGRVDDAIACYTPVANLYEQDGFLLKSVAVRKQMLRLDSSRIDIRLSLWSSFRQLGLESDANEQDYAIAALLGGLPVPKPERVQVAPTTPERPPAVGSLVCSFCDKHQSRVRKLIAGPTVYICDGCVTLGAEFLRRSLGGSTPS